MSRQRFHSPLLTCANLNMSRFAHVRKIDLLCVQTRCVYRERIPDTLFEIRKWAASDFRIVAESMCTRAI